MKTNKEAIERIVDKRMSEIVDDVTEQIQSIRESATREIEQVAPTLTDEIEAFGKLATLNIIDLIECGGFIKIGFIESSYHEYLNIDTNANTRSGKIFDHHSIKKGRYRVVLLVEKLPEKEEEG